MTWPDDIRHVLSSSPLPQTTFSRRLVNATTPRFSRRSAVPAPEMESFVSDLGSDDQTTSDSGVLICHSATTKSWSFYWCADRSLVDTTMAFFRTNGWPTVFEVPYSTTAAWCATYPTAALGGQLVPSTTLFPPKPRTTTSSSATGDRVPDVVTSRTPPPGARPPSPRSAKRQLLASRRKLGMSPSPQPPPH